MLSSTVVRPVAAEAVVTHRQLLISLPEPVLEIRPVVLTAIAAPATQQIEADLAATAMPLI